MWGGYIAWSDDPVWDAERYQQDQEERARKRRWERFLPDETTEDEEYDEEDEYE